MVLNLLLAFLALANGQNTIDNGAGPVVATAAPNAGLEKRRIIGWTTRWRTYTTMVDIDDPRFPFDDQNCHECHHQCHRNTETIFVVPSTITEVRSKTFYTYQTIPVPIPVPPCPCAVPPDCRRNGCRRESCGNSVTRPCNSCCHGSGGNNIISTVTLPHTTSAPASSVLILSTKTNSVTIYTQSSPASNESNTTKVSFTGVLLVALTAAIFIA